MSDKSIKVAVLSCFGCSALGVALFAGGILAYYALHGDATGPFGALSDLADLPAAVDDSDWETAYSASRQRLEGQPAPDFSTTTMEGEPWALSDQSGKVVVLDFWASWCGPCIQAMPDLVELQEALGNRDDFELIGVSLDDARADLEGALEEHGITWTQLYEDGKGWEHSAAQLYEVRGIPFVLVIDRNGVVRGFDPSAADVLDLAEELLEEPPPEEQLEALSYIS